MSNTRTSTTSDRRPLDECRQNLVVDYLPMARALAKPLKRAYPWLNEEFESCAALALVEAAQAFDPSRNVRFSTFARLRVWGALRDVQRSHVLLGWRFDAAHAPSQREYHPHYESEGRILCHEASIDPIEAEKQQENLELWLRRLPAKHAAACREIYLYGKSQSEAAEALGCSQSRLSTLHRQSLHMLGKKTRSRKKTRTA
jgi:RNA polymerase sigma factor (sigma-70 family)